MPTGLHGLLSLWLDTNASKHGSFKIQHNTWTLLAMTPEYTPGEFEYEGDLEHTIEVEEDGLIHETFIPFVYKWSGEGAGSPLPLVQERHARA